MRAAEVFMLDNFVFTEGENTVSLVAAICEIPECKVLYAHNDALARLAIRFDLDQRRALDEVGVAAIDAAIRQQADSICLRILTEMRAARLYHIVPNSEDYTIIGPQVSYTHASIAHIADIMAMLETAYDCGMRDKVLQIKEALNISC